MDGEFLDYFQSGEGLKIPSMAEFSKVCQKLYKKERYDFVALSLRALDDEQRAIPRILIGRDDSRRRKIVSIVARRGNRSSHSISPLRRET